MIDHGKRVYNHFKFVLVVSPDRYNVRYLPLKIISHRKTINPMREITFLQEILKILCVPQNTIGIKFSKGI